MPTASPTSFSTETYVQHNSDIADGLEGLGAALAAMAEHGITMKYEETHLVVAEADFVFTASEGTQPPLLGLGRRLREADLASGPLIVRQSLGSPSTIRSALSSTAAKAASIR